MWRKMWMTTRNDFHDGDESSSSTNCNWFIILRASMHSFLPFVLCTTSACIYLSSASHIQHTQHSTKRRLMAPLPKKYSSLYRKIKKRTANSASFISLNSTGVHTFYSAPVQNIVAAKRRFAHDDGMTLRPLNILNNIHLSTRT